MESEGNYVRLHAGTRVHLVRETMASIEARLGHDRFCRIHRGWIVNLDRVRELHVRANGEHELVTHEGRNYRVGRAYRDAVQERLQLGFSRIADCRLRIADYGFDEIADRLPSISYAGARQRDGTPKPFGDGLVPTTVSPVACRSRHVPPPQHWSPTARRRHCRCSC